MFATTLTAPVQTESPRTFAGQPSSRVSPGLAAALDELFLYGMREPDATLDELRLALMGTGYTWSADGKLGYSPERLLLLNEFDRLIGLLGRDARAAKLFE